MRHQVQDLVERHIGRGHFSGEENISVRCPFHKGGEESRPSFSINVTNGVWHCFTCHISGPLPKLLKALGLPQQVIDAELKDIWEELEDNKNRLRWRKRSKWVTRDPFLAETILPETILKPYEWCPTSLVAAGFSPEWLQWMDIGYDKLNSRITYPIRDIYGNLAGVSGGASIIGQHPKYKVYKGRHQDPITKRWIGSDFGPWFDETYPTYEFHNHGYLWNYDQVYPRVFYSPDDVQTVIIVEGFKACLWLLQSGWANTVALMGSSLSDQQFSLLHRLKANVVLFLDNDSAGKKGTDAIARKVRPTQPGVLIAQYPYADDCQPDDLTPEEVNSAISGAEPYPTWKRRFSNVNGWS